MTGDQVRKARRLLGWTEIKLTSMCGFPQGVIQAYETTGRLRAPMHGDKSINRYEIIKSVLEAAGIEFTNGDASGVRLWSVEP